jgi:hypothetical protein
MEPEAQSALIVVDTLRGCRGPTPFGTSTLVQAPTATITRRLASVDRGPAQQDREVIHNRWQRDDWGGPGQRSWPEESLARWQPKPRGKADAFRNCGTQPLGPAANEKRPLFSNRPVFRSQQRKLPCTIFEPLLRFS